MTVAQQHAQQKVLFCVKKHLDDNVRVFHWKKLEYYEVSWQIPGTLRRNQKHFSYKEEKE